jgi:hypothetical protein
MIGYQRDSAPVIAWFQGKWYLGFQNLAKTNGFVKHLKKYIHGSRLTIIPCPPKHHLSNTTLVLEGMLEYTRGHTHYAKPMNDKSFHNPFIRPRCQTPHPTPFPHLSIHPSRPQIRSKPEVPSRLQVSSTCSPAPQARRSNSPTGV